MILWSEGDIQKEEARQKIYDVFDNISSLDYKGETKGRFETYNFVLKNTDEQTLYVHDLSLFSITGLIPT